MDAEEVIHEGKSALQHEIDMLYKAPVAKEAIDNSLSVVDVQKLIDKALMAWTPASMQFQKLIDSAMRAAVKERASSKEGLAEKRAEAALRNQVHDLKAEVEECTKDNKKQKDLIIQVKSLAHKVERNSAVLAELQASSKEQYDGLAAELSRIERKVDASKNEERAKRLGMFNRFNHKHAADVERLTTSLETGLETLRKRHEGEWQTQEQLLRVMREKLDMALIRRLGYLPAATDGSQYSSALHQSSAAAPTVEAIDSPHFPGLAHQIEIQRHKWQLPPSRLIDTREGRSGGDDANGDDDDEDEESLANSSVDTTPLPDCDRAHSPVSSKNSPQKGLGNYPDWTPMDDYSLNNPNAHDDANYPAGLFDQGMDAGGLLESMDNRMDHLSIEIERLLAIRKGEKGVARLVKERKRRAAMGIDADVDDAFHSYDNNDYESQVDSNSSSERNKAGGQVDTTSESHNAKKAVRAGATATPKSSTSGGKPKVSLKAAAATRRASTGSTLSSTSSSSIKSKTSTPRSKK